MVSSVTVFIHLCDALKEMNNTVASGTHLNYLHSSSKSRLLMRRVYTLHLRKTRFQTKYVSCWQCISCLPHGSSYLLPLKRVLYNSMTCKMTFHFLPSNMHSAAIALYEDMLLWILGFLSSFILHVCIYIVSNYS
jgi:hypothetical protein